MVNYDITEYALCRQASAETTRRTETLPPGGPIRNYQHLLLNDRMRSRAISVHHFIRRLLKFRKVCSFLYSKAVRDFVYVETSSWRLRLKLNHCCHNFRNCTICCWNGIVTDNGILYCPSLKRIASEWQQWSASLTTVVYHRLPQRQITVPVTAEMRIIGFSHDRRWRYIFFLEKRLLGGCGCS
jgi:hypothetical protein